MKYIDLIFLSEQFGDNQPFAKSLEKNYKDIVENIIKHDEVKDLNTEISLFAKELLRTFFLLIGHINKFDEINEETIKANKIIDMLIENSLNFFS